jgi:hypothetical protein
MSHRSYLERNGPAALPEDVRSEAVVVKHYFESLHSNARPEPAKQPASGDDAEWWDPAVYDDYGDEVIRDLRRELAEDAADWLRSNEKGWYYR